MDFTFGFVIYTVLGLWDSDSGILLLGYIWVTKFHLKLIFSRKLCSSSSNSEKFLLSRFGKLTNKIRVVVT
jgi:hypothetical protein